MSLLLSVTFACGLVIAVLHVLNRRFVAPVYDVVANLTAFGCAVAASLLLAHWTPALLSTTAMACWLVLARRTLRARRSSGAGPLARSAPPRERPPVTDRQPAEHGDRGSSARRS